MSAGKHEREGMLPLSKHIWRYAFECLLKSSKEISISLPDGTYSPAKREMPNRSQLTGGKCPKDYYDNEK